MVTEFLRLTNSEFNMFRNADSALNTTVVLIFYFNINPNCMNLNVIIHMNLHIILSV